MSSHQQSFLMTSTAILIATCLVLFLQHVEGISNGKTKINILQSNSNKNVKSQHANQGKFLIPMIESTTAPYPEFAHHHLVWINGEKQSQQGIINLVNSYIANGIPVGSVDLEAGWSNGINNFVPNSSKFPNLYQLVKELHKMNIKVFCWTTPLVNVESPNYNDGYNRGFYLNGGRTIEWWKGRGSFIDYTNPDAVNWWHNQLDNVLILNKTDGEGIDGWKTDGTDPYLYELLPYIYGKQGHISEGDYSSMYYNDFLAYSQKVRGPDNVLLVSRATDSFLGAAFFQFAPRDVVFNGWVGNKYANYFGLKETVKNMFHSAWDKYVGFTTEIAGYSGMRLEDKVLYIRWFQLAAFTSAMHNGGYDLHEPWLFNDPNVTALYRKFTQAHMEIVPYLYSSGISAYNSGSSMIAPLNEKTILNPSIWTFYLGKDMLVNPIFDFPGEVNVFFPFGTWVDYFNHDMSFGGGVVPLYNVTFNYTLTLGDFPAFYRAGSILPLNITTDYVNLFGNSIRNGGYLTLAIHYPIMDELQENIINSHGIKVSYLRKSSDNTMLIEISAPNGFRGEFADQNLKYLLDIRGLLPSHYEGYAISQYSIENDQFIVMHKHETLNSFDHYKESSFYHNENPSFYNLRKPNGKYLKLKHQHLWIKVHDVSKGVRILIK